MSKRSLETSFNPVLKRVRHTTSAIPGTDIPEVRRSLRKMREFAENAHPTQPLALTDMLTSEDTIEKFALRFVLGHHLKRSNRVKKSLATNIDTKSISEDSDENEDDSVDSDV